MYNRYIPQPDGTYQKNRISDPPRPAPIPPEIPAPPPCQETPPPPPCPPPEPKPALAPPCRQNLGADTFLRQLLPKDFDTGDLMVVLLLLLMAGDCPEDKNNAILTLALYFLM